MHAIVLAGGKGTRLKPITDYIPKPLIPLKNTPLLEWQIKYLKKFGIRELVISSGYRSQQIESFFNMKKNFGIKIKFSVEKKPLGTGGAIRKAVKLIADDSFFVINGDIITNIDINKMKKNPNSIAAIPLKTKFGIINIKEDKVLQFQEKKDIQNLWMNAGIYYLSKDIVKYLPYIGDVEKITFPKLAVQGKLHVVKYPNSKWYSIDSFKDMEECSLEINKIIK